MLELFAFVLLQIASFNGSSGTVQPAAAASSTVFSTGSFGGIDAHVVVGDTTGLYGGTGGWGHD